MDRLARRNRFYLLGQGFALAVALYMTLSESWTYREVAWGIWISSFSSAIFLILGSLVSVLGNVSLLSATARAEKLGQRGTRDGVEVAPALRVLGAFLARAPTLFAIVFFHTIVGLLLSVTAPIDPPHLFGHNGFINADPAQVLGALATRYWPLILGTVLSKFWILLEASSPITGRYLFGGIGALITFLVSSAFLLPALHLQPADYENAGLILLVGLVYFPWGLFARDTRERKQDRVPNRAAPLSLPIQRTERHSIFVVGFILAFSLLFIALPVRGLYLLLSGTDSLVVYVVLSTVLLGFLAVGTWILCLGRVMGSYRRELFIDQAQVHLRSERREVTPPFRKKKTEFQESLAAYVGIGSKEHRHTNRTGAGAVEYSLYLVHSADPSRNVELYNAPFNQELRRHAKELSTLLNLPVLEGYVAAAPTASSALPQSPISSFNVGAPPGKKITLERTPRGTRIKYKRVERIPRTIYVGTFAPLFALALPGVLQWSLWTVLNSPFFILFAVSVGVGLVCGYIAYTEESLFVSEAGIRAQFSVFGYPAISLFFPSHEIEDVSISNDGFALRISLSNSQKQFGRGLSSEELEWLKTFLRASLPKIDSDATASLSYR